MQQLFKSGLRLPELWWPQFRLRLKKNHAIPLGWLSLFLWVHGQVTAASTEAMQANAANPATIRLGSFFSDNMVLQADYQGCPEVTVWGWAQEGDKIKIQFRKREYPSLLSAQAGKDGRWKISLGRLEPGGPDELAVVVTPPKSKSAHRLVLTNVGVGDVWLLGTWRSTNSVPPAGLPAPELNAASRSRLRLLPVNRWTSEPDPGRERRWNLVTMDSTGDPQHSSTAWYFGCEMIRTSPQRFVGIIETSGRVVDGLVPWRQGYSLNQLASRPLDACYTAWQLADRDYRQAQALYLQECEKAQIAGKVFTGEKPEPPQYLKSVRGGSFLFSNEPMAYPIAGALWWTRWSINQSNTGTK